MSETLEGVLSQHQFLSGLPEGTVGLVASCAELVTFGTGSLLLSEGGVANTLYLVYQGRVAIEIHGPTQDRLIIETVEPGQAIGLSWAAPPFRWQFDARALEPVATVAIDSERLRQRLGENPEVGYALLGRLSSVALKRLQATRVRLIDLYQYHREGGGQPGAADETLEAVLRRHQFLSGLPEGTVELVASCAELVPFETGTLLLSEGGVADTLYLVYRGRVAIEIHRPTQDRLIIETVEPGQVVGLSWAAPSIRWQFDARALDPVATVAIDSERLRQRLGENPAVGYALLGRLSSVVLERLQATRISLIDLYQYHREGGGHPGAASETLDAVLSRHQFLSGLPEGTLDLVASCAELVTFETGSLLLGEGGVADTLYLVHRGRVAIEIHGPTQDRVVIETVEPGQVVGLSWAAPPFRWQFDARALGRVATVAIDSERLRERLRENPAVGYALLGRLSSVVLKRLQATRVRLIDLYGVGSGH